jgi:hypothetical protein
VKSCFLSYSASQSYNSLDCVKQCIVQDFKDALMMLGSPPVKYLTDVVCDSKSAPDYDTFALIYKGEWKEKQVRVKKFRHVEPPVFLILSDTLHCLTL